jgi:pyruvate,orthophosphate dikinase
MDSQSLSEHVYFLRGGTAPVRQATAELVGNKAANLFRMAQAGLPVPPAFVFSTDLCRQFFQQGRQLPDGFDDLLSQAVRQLEKTTGLTFGGERRPMLVSVRSGAAVSMPGMMDSILNIGLSERTLAALIRMTGNPRLAWDSYRRLIQAYAEVVHGLSGDPFEQFLQERMRAESVPEAAELDVATLQALVGEYLASFEEQAHQPFPQDPMQQLRPAVEAVFRSWESPRAVSYRRLHNLNDLTGTAVTVQAMVFGNMGGTSGSGVAFTRDPATGEKRLYLDFARNAQGDDVVSGRCALHDSAGLELSMPLLFADLLRAGKQLEMLFRDVQDFEFTLQEGRLYLLQSRNAKRTAAAALRIACDLVQEQLITEDEALERLDKYDLDNITSTRLVVADNSPPLCRGTPASPGAAVGSAAFDLETAAALAATGQAVILVRTDISPADIQGLQAAAGILTARGGRTSHAAVVARQLNKVCIVGCRDLLVSKDPLGCRIGTHAFAPGDTLSLDGYTGNVYAGKLEVVGEKPSRYLEQIQDWRNRERRARQRSASTTGNFSR